MPLYEYKCQTCGIFEEWRTMDERDDGVYCPTCETPSQRIFSAPMILSSSLRLKQENPEPQLIKRNLEPKPAKVRHHTGSRPWMIGH